MIPHEEKYHMRHYKNPGQRHVYSNSKKGKSVPFHDSEEHYQNSRLLSLVLTMFEGKLVSTTSELCDISDLLPVTKA